MGVTGFVLLKLFHLKIVSAKVTAQLCVAKLQKALLWSNRVVYLELIWLLVTWKEKLGFMKKATYAIILAMRTL